MRKVVVLVAVIAVLLAPGTFVTMFTLAATVAAASTGTCGLAAVGAVRDSLTATAGDGVTIRLDRTQLTHAATLIKVGSRTPGIGRDGVLVALMAALTESSLRMLANTSAWPQSARFANDGNGGDHDSLGLFQMRPLAGWGTVAELMDSTYQARAFFGGPNGPNHGSPRGLLDIPGWRTLPKGAAAQAVEVSAFPDRYARFEPVAERVIAALTRSASHDAESPEVPETGEIVFPLPAGSWTPTSQFGMRTDPVTGAHTLHTGSDYTAPAGTPILAAADGRVVFAGDVSSGYGHLILINHTVNGSSVHSGYAHMYAAGIHVRAGQRVSAGQHIADVGTDGKSTGPHLHFEIRRGGAYGTPSDATRWLTDHGATDQPKSSSEESSGNCRQPLGVCCMILPAPLVTRDASGASSCPDTATHLVAMSASLPLRQVRPDLGATAGTSDLREIVGALLTYGLLVSVTMLIVSAIAWAIASSTGSWHGATRAKGGVLVALGGAILTGGTLAWANWLIDIGVLL